MTEAWGSLAIHNPTPCVQMLQAALANITTCLPDSLCDSAAKTAVHKHSYCPNSKQS